MKPSCQTKPVQVVIPLTGCVSMGIEPVASDVSYFNRGSYIDQFEQQLAEQRRRLEKQQVEELERALQDCEKRLREEYDAKLEKNYHLIEQLIAEKKELTEQCDKLVNDMRQISEKAQAKQKRMEDKDITILTYLFNHKVELKKVEAKAIAAEKIKRERWEAAKTKTIKDDSLCPSLITFSVIILWFFVHEAAVMSLCLYNLWPYLSCLDEFIDSSFSYNCPFPFESTLHSCSHARPRPSDSYKLCISTYTTRQTRFSFTGSYFSFPSLLSLTSLSYKLESDVVCSYTLAYTTLCVLLFGTAVW
ncbi:hypothetical protein ACTXT7_001210 [Hymenolepis weldensis]